MTVNADADVSLAVNAASEHFPVARSGGITHAVVIPRGGIVAGTSAVLRTEGWTWEEMAAVRSQSLVVRWPDRIPARYAALLGPPKSLADRKKESDELIENTGRPCWMQPRPTARPLPRPGKAAGR